MNKQSKTKNKFHLTLLIGSVLMMFFGLLSMAGGLMSSSMTDESLGDVFDIFFNPLIFFVIPLLLVKFSLRKLYSFTLPSWLIYIVIVLSFILSFTASFGQTYNYFVQKDEAIKKAYSNVEIIYSKKFDLIPGISQSVDKYTEHEKEIINSIVDARKTINQSENVNDQVNALNSFDLNIRSLMLNYENYPNLNSSDLVLELIDSMREVEGELVIVKQKYNESVEMFNKNYKMFPYNFIAKKAGYEEKQYFKKAN